MSTSARPAWSELATLVHKLNQPLAAILTNAQAAQHYLTGSAHAQAELRGILADIVEDNRRAVEIIKEMRQRLRNCALERRDAAALPAEGATPEGDGR